VCSAPRAPGALSDRTAANITPADDVAMIFM
jgi:hypothetical protein